MRNGYTQTHTNALRVYGVGLKKNINAAVNSSLRKNRRDWIAEKVNGKKGNELNVNWKGQHRKPQYS